MVENLEIKRVYKDFEGMRFCKLYKNTKMPIGEGWTNVSYSYEEAIEHSYFGVLGGYGDYLIIDLDNNFNKAFEILKKYDLTNTFVVESGSSTEENRKAHYYFRVKDLSVVKLPRKHRFGEFVGKGFQVVAAGNLHEKTKRPYKIVANPPILEVSASDIQKLIDDKDFMPEEKVLQGKESIIEGLQIRYLKEIEVLLDSPEVQNIISNTEGVDKNHMLFPNIAAFVYHINDDKKYKEYYEKAQKFADLCGHGASWKGYLKPDSFIAPKQFKDFIVNLKVDHLIYDKFIPDSSSILNYKSIKEPEWLALDYIQKSTTTVVSADGGGGKSFLTAYEACCLVSGNTIFGRFPTIKSKVLLVNNEDDKFYLYQRCEAIRKGLGFDEKMLNDIHHVYFNNLIEDDKIRELYNLVKNNNIDYIIIDNVRSHFSTDLNENQSSEIYAKLRPIMDMLRYELGCAIKVLHHTNKGGETSGGTGFKGVGDGLQEFNSNKTKSEDGLSTFINMKFKAAKERNGNIMDNFMVKFTIENKETFVKFNGNDHKRLVIDKVSVETCTEEEKNETVKHTFYSIIIDMLKEHSELTKNDLMTKYPGRKPEDNTVRKYLDNMVKENIISSRKDGRANYYKLEDSYKISLGD